ncbi:type II toxin-antitoxin system VapC family toxin [Rhizobium sp. KDH_Rht_773_N]
MRFLLDTHAFLWWLIDDPKLPENIRDLLADPANEIYVSAASAWEIATKHRKGKLPTGEVVLPDFRGVVLDNGFDELAITSAHMVTSAMLPGTHNDPFDRILAAQAIIENIALITIDSQIETLGVLTRW